MKHIKLSDIAMGNISDTAKQAADKAHEAGGSPRAQLDAAREATGNRSLSYVSHQGARKRERNLRRMKKNGNEE